MAEKHGLVRSIFAKFDRELSGILKKAKDQGHVIPCKEGCFWCCMEPLYCSRQEAELVVDRIQEMPVPEQDRIKALVRDWKSRFVASGLHRTEEVNAFEYRKLRLWCPLLKDGRCLVYADRPTGCRAHIAKDTSKGCEDDELRKTQKFLHVSAMMRTNIVQEILLKEDTELEHLGLWLLELLMGERFESASRTVIQAAGRPKPVPMLTNAKEGRRWPEGF